MRQKRTSAPQILRRYRYAASATRRGRVRISPKIRRRILLYASIAVVTIAVALIWGNALKRSSDAYRDAQLGEQWTIPESISPVHVHVPDFRGGLVSPGDTIASFPADANGVAILLSENENGQYEYVTPTSSSADLSVADGAPTLESEVRRLHQAGLRVLGIFDIRCLSQVFLSDTTAAVLRRGIEQSLLSSAAQAGIDEILLTGIPCGNDTTDADAMEFLREVKEILADQGTALGITLSPNAFVRVEGESAPDIYVQDGTEDGVQQYTGWRTPGRMLSVCDYLALDLRAVSTTDAEGILRGFRFSYPRYSLRLLLSDADISAYADTHGMLRQIVLVPDRPTQSE